MTQSHPPPDLTPREREVLAALCRPALGTKAFSEPASVREIARALFVTEAAVKQHLLRIYDKFGLHDRSAKRRVQLANAALDLGLVDTEPAEVEALELLSAGRTALERRAWRDAFDCLSRAETAGAELSADDLARLGEAAIWAGEVEASQEARLRAYNAFVEAGDDRRAARLALDLVINHFVGLRYTVAAGWANKARRRLEEVPEGPEHGQLAAVDAMFLQARGDLDGALAKAQQAFEVGRRCADSNLTALGMTLRASALTQLGRQDEAMPLFDDAMASAATGELHPLVTGIVYCRTLCACIDLCDYRRALDWTAEVERACKHASAVGFPGDCRAHHAQVLAARGEWDEAEREARTACLEARAFDLAHVGLAEVQIGLLLLRTGKLDDAEAAFQRASELGALPEPGLSLLSLARGDPEAAATSIAGALAEVGSVPLKRAQLLPVQVEVSLARGDLNTARNATEELESIAAEFDTLALQAAALCARGAVARASGELDAAARALRQGAAQWLQVGAPYEAARAQELHAEVLAAQGNGSASSMELRGAQTVYQRLGAAADRDRVAGKLSTS